MLLVALKIHDWKQFIRGVECYAEQLITEYGASKVEHINKHVHVYGITAATITRSRSPLSKPQY